MNSIETISIQWDTPKFKVDEVSLQKAMNLFVGSNSSGKTMVLLHAFMGVAILRKITASTEDPESIAQFVLQHTLEGFETFTGHFSLTMEEGETLVVHVVEGEVCNVTTDGLTFMSNIPPLIYLTSAMRLFSQIDLYTKMRYGISTDKLSDKDRLKLLSLYKLPDLTYIETLIAKCPLELPKYITNQFFEGEGIPQVLDFDTKAHRFVVHTKEGETKFASSYGSGHQAMLNMIAATCI